MIRSMTGFARSTAEGEWGELTWELRSVNHRYLDISMRLPDEARALEADFRQQVSALLGRGKVECALRLRTAGAGREFEIDEQRLAALAEGCRRVAAVLPETAPADPLRALGWPGVLREAPPDSEALGAAAVASLDTGLAELNHAREAEGERLAAVLRERAAEIVRLAQAVRDRLPAVRDAWRARLSERLSDLDTEGDPGRLEQEMAILAQRMDVDEELSRLESHAQAFEEALERDEPVGRRLDFLMQEFNREANTVASKSQDADITACAVDMKVLIEQMREQVQNIE